VRIPPCVPLQVAAVTKEREAASAALEEAQVQRDRQTEHMDKMEVSGGTPCALQKDTVCLAEGHRVPCRRTPCALQRDTVCLAEGHRVLCRGTPCALQKDTVCLAEGHRVPCRRTPCALQKDTVCLA